MNLLLDTLFKTVRTPMANLLVALAGPTLRKLQLDPASLKTVLAQVGNLFSGTPNTYAVMGEYTAIEQEDIAKSVHAALQALMTQFGVVLDKVELDEFLTALGDRVALRYPKAVTA